MKAMLAVLMFSLAPCAFAHPQETTAYKYDALGRLVETSTSGGPNNGTHQQIEHDKAGNRTNYTVTGATGSAQTGLRVIVVPLNGFTVIPLPGL